MTSAELLQKKEQLQQQIEQDKIQYFTWINSTVIPALKEKFNVNFNLKLQFEIKENYARLGMNKEIKQYYLDGDMRDENRRGGYAFHMSCYRDKEYHFSPSLSSTYSNEIETYAEFLFELANWAKQANDIHDFIWNHPEMLAKANAIYASEESLLELDAEIKQQDLKVKIDYIDKIFEENKGTFKISGIKNRNRRYISTDFISFKKFVGNEVYLKDSKNATVICTVDEVYRTLGGK